MIINLILCALSVALWWTTTSLHPLFWAAWFAPLPLLWIARRSRHGWAVFAWAFLAWSVGSLSQWTYLTQQIRLPVVIAAVVICSPGLVLGLAVALWRGFLRRGVPLGAALSFALTWVVFEFAKQSLSPHSTFSNLGYSQVDFLPVLQLASLAGLAGIVFLLFFLPGALATGNPATIAVALLLGGAAYWWGGERLKSPQGTPLAVALISSDKFPKDAVAQRDLLHQYATRAARLADGGAKLVLIPEKIAVVKEIPVSEIDSIFGDAARHGARVVVGLERWTSEAKLNEARVYTTSTGALEAVYEKHHMLPPMESHLLVGQERVKLTGNLGVAICKDMDFPALSREYGNDGMAAMLVPAWDFHADGWMHARMAVVRGVENGFGLVRSAKEGMMTVSDSRGRVLAERSSDTSEFSELTAEARLGGEPTLYRQWGDWFSWASAAALAVLLMARPRRRIGG